MVDVKNYLFLFVLLSSIYAAAVRFGDDGNGRSYPDAVAGLEHRSHEVESFIPVVPLAANFPFLHLADHTKNANGFQNYLDSTAEVMISQAPEELRRQLRKMYFEGQNLSESNELWRATGGQRLLKATVFFANGLPRFQVETVEGINSLPTLKKFLRVLAIVEIVNASIAYHHFSKREYRLYHHVLNAVNQITLGLLVEEILRNTNLGSLQNEIAHFTGPENIRSALEELIEKNQLQNKMVEIKRENYRVKVEDIAKWIELARFHRHQKCRAITGLSQMDRTMDQIVNQEILEMEQFESANKFRLIRDATMRGDQRMARLLKSSGSLLVSGGQNRCDSIFN